MTFSVVGNMATFVGLLVSVAGKVMAITLRGAEPPLM